MEPILPMDSMDVQMSSPHTSHIDKPILSLPVYIHLPIGAAPDERTRTPTTRSTILAVRKWLDKSDVPYGIDDFTTALIKLFLMNKSRQIDVRLLLVKDNLCFANIYLRCANLSPPMQLADGNPAFLYVFSHVPKCIGCKLAIKKPPNTVARGSSAATTHPTTQKAPRRPASCGFVDCDGSCTSAPVSERKHFVLDTMLDFVAVQGARLSEETKSHNYGAEAYANAVIGPNDRLSRMDPELIRHIASFCAPAELRALSRTNRTIKQAIRHTVPGLKLDLYAHQKAALDRMLAMERRRPRRPDPLLRCIATVPCSVGDAGKCLVVFDAFDGSLYALHRVPSVPLPRGGMIADEPGMGKSITGLALILKTLGFRASPPAGVPTRYLSVGPGRPRIAYFLTNEMPSVQAGSEAGIVKQFPKRSMRILNSVSSDGNLIQQEATSVRILQDAVDREKRPKRVLRYIRPPVKTAVRTRHIYLSGATVIFCPRELVVHWERQILKHTHKDTLRVLTVRKSAQFPREGDLALSYDVIIVSYSALSSLHYAVTQKNETMHPMTGVRFLRIIFDEGHKLGSGTNFHDACFLVKAERRFIMTGTPVSSTPNSDCEQLYSALHFLREPTFGLDHEAWAKIIRRPYNDFRVESLTRLRQVLGEVMIRTNKSSVPEIPGFKISNVFIKFPEQNARAYNALVRVITRNLLTSDWFMDKHDQSLLNPSQGRELNLVLTNLRRACNYGLNFQMTVGLKDLVSMLENLLALSLTYKHGNLSKIKPTDRKITITDLQTITSLVSYEPPVVQKDSLRLNLKESKQMFPDIEPTYGESVQSHFFGPRGPFNFESKDRVGRFVSVEYGGYLEFISKAFRMGERCQKCTAFTTQLMVTPCACLLCPECMLTSRKCCPIDTCRTPYQLDENGVPEQMIELQPSIWNESTWKPVWSSTASGKLEYLLGKLRKIKERNDEMLKNGLKPKKVIIFSQLREHLMLVSVQLKKPEFMHSYADFYYNEADITYVSSNADKHFDKQLKKFRTNPECFILLLGKRKGSVGLDLSFVDTIFLMEAVWDRALEKQVIARAHRLGATSMINVERLIMKDSVEEDILRSSLEVTSGVKSEKKDAEDNRKKAIITNLKIVTPVDDNMFSRQDGDAPLPDEFVSPLHSAYRSRIKTLLEEEAKTPKAPEHNSKKRRKSSLKGGRNVKRKLWG